MRRGIVAAELNDHFTGATDHRHRHALALRLAGLGGGRRDGQRRGERQVLAGEQLGARRRGEGAGQRHRDEANERRSHLRSSL